MAPTAAGYLLDIHAGCSGSAFCASLVRVAGRDADIRRLEVVGHDRGSGELIVVAGFGRSAQWYRNVRAGNAAEIAIGRRRFRPRWRELAVPEASATLAEYERRNRRLAPLVRLVPSRLVGGGYDGSPAARERLVSQLPMLGVRPW